MSRRFKIAYVFQSISTDFAEPSAVQVHIYHQIHALQQAGHHVDLLALQGRKALCTADLQVFQRAGPTTRHYGALGLSGSGAFKVFESAARRLQNELNLPYLALFDSYRTYDACRHNLQRHDLIHERYNLLACGAAWASRRLGIPYVLEVNADMLAERQTQDRRERGVRSRFAAWAARICYDSAHRIICVSHQLKDHLVRNWQVNPAKIVVLPNAADTETFGRSYDTSPLRRQLGLQDKFTIMFVGGFYLWHDLALLVKSFAHVHCTLPEARLVLVGDGRTRRDVEQIIVELGLQSAVIMTGAIEHHRVPEFLALADIAVAPNISFFDGHGGSPLKLFEYMAAGKAIIATRTGQVAEVIKDGHNGLLVEAGDVDAFARAILALLQDPDLRRRLGRQARRQAIEQHSWQQYGRQLQETYAGVLPNKPIHKSRVKNP